jgi:hypothetical protein
MKVTKANAVRLSEFFLKEILSTGAAEQKIEISSADVVFADKFPQ